MHIFAPHSSPLRFRTLQPSAGHIDRWDPVMKNAVGFVTIKNEIAVHRCMNNQPTRARLRNQRQA
jgi:hypothetical protein